MDDSQFDSIARTLGATTARRSALGLLVALGLGGAAGFLAPVAGKKQKKSGKKKKKKQPQNRLGCAPAAKPNCAENACYRPVCDTGQKSWSCRNVCAGTSTPLCLGGQCVDACDEALALIECGDQCCNPLVHSECCDGACCDLDQRCDDGLCVKRCDGWGDVRGGRLEYTMTYWDNEDVSNSDGFWRHHTDDTATAAADLECRYRTTWGELDCDNLGGTISGTHTFHSESFHALDPNSYHTRDESGSGSEALPAGLWPGLAIRLPESDEDPATYTAFLVPIAVEGTWQENTGLSGTDTYYLPGDYTSGLMESGLQPLPATPQPLTGTREWSYNRSWPNLVRVTWTFTPELC